MDQTPDQRIARLTRHVVQGWSRASQDEQARRRAIRWLQAHPSAMPEVDALWLAALDGEGPLARWIAAAAVPLSWDLEIPLHSVLACHPFADLPDRGHGRNRTSVAEMGRGRLLSGARRLRKPSRDASVFETLHPEDGSPEVTRVVADAARLMAKGELIVFGSSALAFWMKAPPRSKDVDIWCIPAEKGHAIEALMGELSWYHEKHGMFVEVWGPETFAAPSDWRERSKRLLLTENRLVSVILPHPHDVMLAKLERMDVKDREHVRGILAEYPIGDLELDLLVGQMPHRRGPVAPDRLVRFEAGLAELLAIRAAG